MKPYTNVNELLETIAYLVGAQFGLMYAHGIFVKSDRSYGQVRLDSQDLSFQLTLNRADEATVQASVSVGSTGSGADKALYYATFKCSDEPTVIVNVILRDILGRQPIENVPVSQYRYIDGVHIEEFIAQNTLAQVFPTCLKPDSNETYQMLFNRLISSETVQYPQMFDDFTDAEPKVALADTYQTVSRAIYDFIGSMKS